MDNIVQMILALLIGYGLGSIPFGLVLTKIFNAGDLRSIGSGNIGATNVLRTGNKWLAALTLILDLLKGFFAVILTAYFFPSCEPLAAAGAFFGHLYPVWLGFKGGKGVATYAGIMFGLFWEGGLIYAAVWILALALFRISSLAGLLAAIAAPVAALSAEHRSSERRDRRRRRCSALRSRRTRTGEGGDKCDPGDQLSGFTIVTTAAVDIVEPVSDTVWEFLKITS